MTWTKLGDEFGPESADLTNGEFRIHVEALVYSNWRLLDLFIPGTEVRRFAGSPDVGDDIAGLVARAGGRTPAAVGTSGCGSASGSAIGAR